MSNACPACCLATILALILLAPVIYFEIKSEIRTRSINEHGNKDWHEIEGLFGCLSNDREIVEPMRKLQLRIIENEEINLALNDKLAEAIEKAKNALTIIKMHVSSTSNGLVLKPTHKNIRLIIKNCNELEFMAESEPIEMVEYKWSLQANCSRVEGWLGLHLHLKPPDGHFRVEVDFALSILNAFSGNDIVLKQFRKIYQNDNYTIGHGHGWNRMAKIEDLMNATNGFIHPDGSIEVKADFTIKSATLNHLDD